MPLVCLLVSKADIWIRMYLKKNLQTSKHVIAVMQILKHRNVIMSKLLAGPLMQENLGLNEIEVNVKQSVLTMFCALYQIK